MYENIPAELRALRQWVCADMRLNANGDPRKLPLNPRTGQAAKVNDPSTWGTFEEAIAGASAGYPPGFVFTTDDPYAIIDLDNKKKDPATPDQLALHQRIIDMIESYTERSISGTGYHIVVKGAVPKGTNRDKVELYSWGRMMIFTGNVVKALPIVDYSELITNMFGSMNKADPAKGHVELTEFEPVMDDQDIVNMAMAARNGDKYLALCKGEWKELGLPSASEGDLALISMLCYYTKSNSQVKRLFMYTALGRREKMNPTKFEKTLRRVRNNEPDPVDFSKLDLSQASILQNTGTPPPEHPTINLATPPGVLGRIAHYVYKSSPRPVMEMAVMASIAFLAGIAGRAYHFSNTGLNQYCVVIAPTGSGKEAMKSGLDALFLAIREKVPGIDVFRGPGAFASGQGLNRVLEEKNCFVSIMGEFGILMKRVLDPRASAADVMFKQSLLKLFNSSGPSQYYDGTAYSDREKNIKSIRAPAVTILGEAAPKDFFEALSEGEAATGFVPRLLLYQYEGVRPHFNEASSFAPADDLVEEIAMVATKSILLQGQNQSIAVQADADATKLLKDFNIQIDERMRQLGDCAISEILNRSHFKALRLAALLAVSVNCHEPIITGEMAHWAIAFIDRADHIVISRFESGDVGSGDSLFEPTIRHAVRVLREMSHKQKLNAKWPAGQLDAPYIPFNALRDWLKRRDPFKNHRLGYIKAIDMALADLVDAEILIEIPPEQLPKVPNGKARAYGLGLAW